MDQSEHSAVIVVHPKFYPKSPKFHPKKAKNSPKMRFRSLKLKKITQSLVLVILVSILFLFSFTNVLNENEILNDISQGFKSIATSE